MRHLKTFLDYANRGPRSIDEASAPVFAAMAESPLEADIAKALEARGWKVHPQVGCSGYRIDIGVLNPDEPGSYLLGIECDGATYHSARSARDRDRIRQSVLEGLGWRIHRIWSTDWWLQPEEELARAVAAIEHAQANPRPTAAPKPPPPPPEPAAELAAGLSDLPEGPSQPPEAVPYEVTHLDWSRPKEEFYRAYSLGQIATCFAQVLAVEAPIHMDEAARRIAACWDVKRISKTIRGQIQGSLERMASGQRPVQHGNFWWRADQDPETWNGIRVPGVSRAADLIPPEEVANAAGWVLSRALSIDRMELARETAQVFGITRMGKRVVAAMDAGIEVLVVRGRAKMGTTGERVEQVE